MIKLFINCYHFLRMGKLSKVIIIGSAPDATKARELDLTFFDKVIVINNAWKIITNWNELIFPYDFPDNKKPNSIGNQQRLVTEKEFVPAQESLGGFVYAGATMAFTAGYWALVEHTPSLMCFLGCNMFYPSHTQTHFYGSGRKDPLRDDISLTSLKARSRRLLAIAKMRNCELISLSSGLTNLDIPQVDFGQLDNLHTSIVMDDELVADAFRLEESLGYFFRGKKYWEFLDQIDKTKLIELDRVWVDACSF